MSDLGAVLRAFRDGWRIAGAERHDGRAYWRLVRGASPMVELMPIPTGWIAL